MGDGAAYGVALRYTVEEAPLGTGGGVRNALDLLGGRLALVLNGDVLTDVDLSAMLAFHEQCGAAATIELLAVPDPTPYGLVELDAAGRVRRFTEKPDPAQVTTDTINAGIYVLDPRLLERIPAGRAVSIEREFFPELLADRVPFYGWVGRHYWLDIGSPAKYRQAQLDLMAGAVSTGVAAGDASRPRIGQGVELDATASAAGPCVIGAGSRLGPGCRVGPLAAIGERCVLERGARVTGAVIWERVAVGEEATLTDCLVAEDVHIGAGAVVGPGAILPAGAVIPERARVDA